METLPLFVKKMQLELEFLTMTSKVNGLVGGKDFLSVVACVGHSLRAWKACQTGFDEG